MSCHEFRELVEFMQRVTAIHQTKRTRISYQRRSPYTLSFTIRIRFPFSTVKNQQTKNTVRFD